MGTMSISENWKLRLTIFAWWFGRCVAVIGVTAFLFYLEYLIWEFNCDKKWKGIPPYVLIALPPIVLFVIGYLTRRKLPNHAFTLRWFAYFLVCFVGAYIWIWYGVQVSHSKQDLPIEQALVWCLSPIKPGHETVVAFITMMTLFVALVALDLAYEHKGELAESLKTLHKLEELVKTTHGLGEYIRQASQIYKDKRAERVVTSLRYWAAGRKSGGDIQAGLNYSAPETKFVFVGYIDWDCHFPGVLWRLVKVRELLKKPGREKQVVDIYHVPTNIPLFVVSKISDTTDQEDKGSLLVANPMPDAGTVLYGIDLGNANPKQVLHYNFIFDTLICPVCPDRSTTESLNKFLTDFGVSRYDSCDAIGRILSLPDFTDRLGATVAVINGDVEKASNELLDKIAANISDALKRKMDRMRDPDEREFLLEKDEVERVTRDFIAALRDASSILIEDTTGDIGRKLKSKVNGDLPHTCRTFFRGQVSA